MENMTKTEITIIYLELLPDLYKENILIQDLIKKLKKNKDFLNN